MRIRVAVSLFAALLVCTACFANPSDPASSAVQSPPPQASSSAVEPPPSSSGVSAPSSSAPSSSAPSSSAPSSSASKPSSSEAPVPASSVPRPVETPAVEPVASTPPKAPAPSQPDTPQAASSAPAQASPDEVPGVPPISGAAEEELRQARENAKNPILPILVVDKQGNPVPELPITIEDGVATSMLGRTSTTGQVLWRRPKAGEWDVVIDEQWKIFRRQEYRITVTEGNLEPIVLVWDYEDTSKFPIPIKSTITMTFEDENGKPLVGLTIDIDINARETADHTEEVLLLGKTDANGQIKWQNPNLGVHNISAYGKTHKGLFPLDVLKHQDTQLEFTVSAK